MTRDELKYLLALKEVNGIGNVLAKHLIKTTGSAKEVFNLSAGKILKVPRISENTAKKILHYKDFEWIEKEIEWCEKESISIIPFYDNRYPQRLLHCNDAPLLLFAKGNMDLNPKRMVSIVGTRHNTAYGQKVTENIVEALSALNVTIVSGLALGIDGIAHRSALSYHTPTIAVLGHGLNQIYPRQHLSISDKMQQDGGLLTEFSRKSPFDKNNFPMRNRIVAGMSDATIVIESAKTGGAMITAEIAHSYGREVFAVPGKWGDNVSQGTNSLIKNLKAQIITQAEDIAELLGWKVREQLVIEEFYERKKRFQNLDEEETKIVSCMANNEPCTIDNLHYATDIPINKLSAILLSLEFKGVLKALPGKSFLLK